MADTRLFEKLIEASPAYDALQKRIAFGRAGVETKNMTLQNLIDWLKSAMSSTFIQAANNLSELANKATARTNLSVYAKSETYTQTEVNNLINNVTSLLGGIRIVLSGGVNADGTYLKFSGSQPMTASKLDTGEYQVIHSLGSNDYMVLATCNSGSGFESKISDVDYSNDSFIIRTGDDAAGNDSAFRFIMIAF